MDSQAYFPITGSKKLEISANPYSRRAAIIIIPRKEDYADRGGNHRRCSGEGDANIRRNVDVHEYTETGF